MSSVSQPLDKKTQQSLAREERAKRRSQSPSVSSQPTATQSRSEFSAALRDVAGRSIEESHSVRLSSHIRGYSGPSPANMATTTTTRTTTSSQTLQSQPLSESVSTAGPRTTAFPLRENTSTSRARAHTSSHHSRSRTHSRGRSRTSRHSPPDREPSGTPSPDREGPNDGAAPAPDGDDGNGPGGNDSGDDGGDGSDDEINNLPDPMKALVKAMVLGLNKANSGGGSSDKTRARVRDPEPYDGKDPELLRTFLFQGILNFNDRPKAFTRDSQKVNYMISYLTGDALGWFEPEMVNPDPTNPPAWLDNYAEFVAELQRNFGSYDPRQEAENEISTLTMPSDSTIQKYLVRFNKLSLLTGWNDQALRKVFYDGLPERIQIKMRDLPGGKPTTLKLMKLSAQTIDASHWEWKREVGYRRSRTSQAPSAPPTSSKNNTTVGSSGGRTGSSSSNAPKTNSSGGSSKDKKTSGGNSGNAGGSSGGSSSSSDKPYANILGANGKLLESERKRRIENNLCLRCGQAGHRATDCPRRSAAGRAAQADAPADTDSGN